MDHEPPFSRPDQSDNVVPPDVLVRQREARLADRYLAKLAHPALIGQATHQLNNISQTEDPASEDRRLFDLIYGGPPPDTSDRPDPLETLFEALLPKALSAEQVVALNALRKLHQTARRRGDPRELQHVRAIARTIVGKVPRPPQGPSTVA